MRKKILVGFASIAFLLFFSVVVTIYQLGKLSNTTGAVIDRGSANIEFSKRMLDAVQEENTALLEKIVTGLDVHDSVMVQARADFDAAYANLTPNISEIILLDSISAAKIRYEQAVASYDHARTPEDNLDWFVAVYRSNYNDITDAIKNYMVSVDRHLSSQAAELGDRAYRVITPSVLTLIVMLMIIGMFFLFVDLYFVKPVAGINKSLGNYLKQNMPFSVKTEGRDEVFQLYEKIEELITLYKSVKNR